MNTNDRIAKIQALLAKKVAEENAKKVPVHQKLSLSVTKAVEEKPSAFQPKTGLLAALSVPTEKAPVQQKLSLQAKNVTHDPLVLHRSTSKPATKKSPVDGRILAILRASSRK